MGHLGPIPQHTDTVLVSLSMAAMLAVLYFRSPQGKADRLYEDEVGGALVDEGDEGDLMSDLVRKALGDLPIGRAEGIFSIGNDQLVTNSPMGSPTAISPRLVTLADLMARRREIIRAGRARTRSAPSQPDNQMSLF